MKNFPHIIVVCGPTATGKSDYAVTLARQNFTKKNLNGQAKKVGGEIISADSRQVYRGLNIGSGKITRREMRGIPHHMLDVTSPKRTFSVAQFKRLADKAIADIIKRGRTPIICGGTGFYIDSVVYDTVLPEVPPNQTLRKKLSKNTPEQNFVLLKKLAPTRARTIEKANNVRLIRAIEIATALGAVPKVKRKKKYTIEWHYLDFPDDVLRERIHIRLLKRMRAGMVREVERLHESGVSWKRLEALGLEYRYLALYLQGKLTKQAMLSELELAIWHFAKRQRTWFKKYAV